MVGKAEPMARGKGNAYCGHWRRAFRDQDVPLVPPQAHGASVRRLPKMIATPAITATMPTIGLSMIV